MQQGLLTTYEAFLCSNSTKSFIHLIAFYRTDFCIGRNTFQQPAILPQLDHTPRLERPIE